MKQVLGWVLPIALVSLACDTVAHAQWGPPRTPDGRPDLQGIWDYRSATPLERPAAGQSVLMQHANGVRG